MTLLDIYHGEEGEARINRLLWRALEEHYPGAIDPKNPSLMADRLFRVVRNVYINMEYELDKEFGRRYAKLIEEKENLYHENRKLRGLPPIAYASPATEDPSPPG